MTNPYDPVLVDVGKRVKVVIGGENYYVYVSESSQVVTCPRENSPDRENERLAMDTVSQLISEMRGGE